MLDSLNLNADQKTQVEQIVGDVRQQLQALRKEAEPKVSAIRQQADKTAAGADAATVDPISAGTRQNAQPGTSR